MTNFYKYDVVVVRFPFASSLKYKARPAVIISSETYNKNKRGTLLIMAISSMIDTKLDFEFELQNWKESGLLKPSVFKSSIATIEKDFIITKLGTLLDVDKLRVQKLITTVC
ncbi:MAG: type II toxin-antitoxin system PemK/MazF family toxin [Sulfurimonas sp.]|uniref:type II toxin-antitoxin system PemK/MazF family toxin n=1 Tax=Sulfurimonas sp. TaxID=2022749 RepID=UPI0026020A6C|nr:type II toxin-antitoxin system PemK/MazF family toxin [Sulfurimonas sp.]MDD2652901.1 type II toxin-antitoxin system PemK/MazF family toxin [Sulfurimonas sp.]MDD3452347.1 type II toxin-antitoxin system PemK/MazF family toxin [Sulfurimonas sp.]